MARNVLAGQPATFHWQHELQQSNMLANKQCTYALNTDTQANQQPTDRANVRPTISVPRVNCNKAFWKCGRTVNCACIHTCAHIPECGPVHVLAKCIYLGVFVYLIVVWDKSTPTLHALALAAVEFVLLHVFVQRSYASSSWCRWHSLLYSYVLRGLGQLYRWLTKRVTRCLMCSCSVA